MGTGEAALGEHVARRWPFPGQLGWWRSPEASCSRPAGRLAEAGPRPPLRGTPAAAAAQLLLSSHSQTASLEARVAMAAVPELLQQQEEDRSKVRPSLLQAPGEARRNPAPLPHPSGARGLLAPP